MPSTTSHTLNRLPFTNSQDPYHSDSGIGSPVILNAPRDPDKFPITIEYQLLRISP